MTNPPVCKVQYRRSRFSTRLPDDRRYTAAHFWLLPLSEQRFRVGFTQFAVRMLGDLVEYGYEIKQGSTFQVGDTLGWIEAFKATTDLYAVGSGTLSLTNPDLERDPTLFDKDCYGAGWLYEFEGVPDAGTVDVQGYTAILDRAIDKIQGKDDAEGTEIES